MRSCARLPKIYKDEKITTIDGVKIDFDNGWVHLRKSNTEPIIRVYSEARSAQEARDLAEPINEPATIIHFNFLSL